VLVEGANRVKKPQRPNPMKGVTGGIIEKEMPLHVSNVALFNPATKKADRIGIRTLEDGRRVRFFKSNGEVVDV
jgi:large subunit ribosomal protein L24